MLSLCLFSLVVISIVIVSNILSVGSLSSAEYATAGVWSVLSNYLPVSPGGIGVGEVTFAQVSRTLETVASGAPYASVILVFRAFIVLSTLPGLVAFITYRKAPANQEDPAMQSTPPAE